MTSEEHTTDASPRPLGYWLRTVDRLLTQEFAAAFDGAEVTRRDWMLLNALDGTVDAPGFAARLARKGKRLDRLVDRGWIVADESGGFSLTDEGRAARERLGGIVDGIRERVTRAVGPEDYATTVASLEKIARELGWDENTPGRPAWGRRGFGPRFGAHRHGFGHRHGHGFGRGGHGEPGRPDCGEHGHGEHGHGEHRGHGRRMERAYERGFDAGFARGRDRTDA